MKQRRGKNGLSSPIRSVLKIRLSGKTAQQCPNDGDSSMEQSFMTSKRTPVNGMILPVNTQRSSRNSASIMKRGGKLVSERFDEDCPIVIGTQNEPVTCITTHDWHGEAQAWNHGMIRRGLECNGYWAIEIPEDGAYSFELRRWPPGRR